MTLRKKLFWLFAPPLLLALLLVGLLGHGLLLGRLDREDEQLLVAEAGQMRALLNTMFERNIDRLQSFAQTLPATGDASHPAAFDPKILARMNFDYVIRLDPQGRVSGEQWRSPEASDLTTLGVPPPAMASLRSDLLQQARRLQADKARQPFGQLVAVQGVATLQVVTPSGAPDADGGMLLAGHFIDSERTATLQRELDGRLRLSAAADGELGWTAMPGSDGRIELSRRQLLDDGRQRISLRFGDGHGDHQLLLELTRKRNLYDEGRHQIGLFLAVSALVAVLAWLLVYLGLEMFLLRRISRMHREFQGIAPDSAGRRLSDCGDDELGRLGREANRTLDRLEQSEARDRAILQAMHDGYFEVDGELRFVAANPALGECLGVPPQALLGRSFAELLDAAEQARLQALLAGEGEEIPLFAGALRRADGSLGHYETRFSAIRGERGRPSGYRGILHDVSEHVAYQNQLIDLAYRDALTGLGNRKAFHEHLERRLATAESPLALLFIDLDRFKQVNDRFGHDVGDALLVVMAERLRHAVRKPDLAYRLGGDEFTLILPDTDAEAARGLAERLLRALGEPLRLGNRDIDFVTPSIGIALHPRHATDAEALVKAADQAMYEAKRQRNRVCLHAPQG